MKIEDNHYTYRIETKDSNGGSLDFIDIDTVEPLRCAYDIQDELNLETNEHIKRVEEIVLDANSTEFWYVDEARTSDTHLVCYFEEVELMASKDHPMVDTNRSVFEYGKINSNEHQDTNFICTHVMDNGVSRIYMSIDKETFGFSTFNNETIKHFISNNPVTVWYALRHEVVIPRSMSKGHLLTLDGQTDITLTTTSEQAKLPIMKFNIGDTQYTLDTNPIHINNTQEGTQIRNIVLEGNTPINYARGNGVNTTEATSNTRYDFEPFYDGQTTIQGTVEGGYVSAKLYGDTMVNIAKSYGETPLLTATNESVSCDNLLGENNEGIVLADGEITEGRIVGNSLVNILQVGEITLNANGSFVVTQYKKGDSVVKKEIKPSTNYTLITFVTLNTLNDKFVVGCDYGIESQKLLSGTMNIEATKTGVFKLLMISPNEITEDRTFMLRQQIYPQATEGSITYKQVLLEGDYTNVDVGYFDTIGSVVNPTVTYSNVSNYFMLGNLSQYDGSIEIKAGQYYSIKMQVPTSTFIFTPNNKWSKIAYYDENNNFIKCDYKSDQIEPITSTPPDNASYVRYGQQITSNNLADIIGVTWKYEDGTDVYPELETRFTTTRILNKLPNGVADYIDVVNKVHVQRVGKVTFNGNETEELWIKGAMNSNNPQKDNLSRFYYNSSGYNNLKTSSSMLSDKLPYSTSADRSEIECVGHMGNAYFNIVVRKDRLSTDNVDGFKTWLQSNPITLLYELATPIYTPLTDEEIAQLPLSAYADGYVMLSSDQLMPSFEFRMKASNRYQVDMLEIGYYYLNAPVGNVKLGTANVDVQQMPCIIKVDNVGTGDSGYRLGFNGEADTTPTTLAKLPSHRIPTSFTQGMRCDTDFGYWEGVKVATGKQLYVNETNKLDFAPIELNRIEYNNTIVEDEFDVATGKLAKRIGKYTIDGNSNLWEYSVAQFETATHMSFCCSSIPNFKKGGRCIGFLGIKQGLPNITNSIECWDNLGVSNNLYFRFRKDRYSQYGDGLDGVKAYFDANPTTIYYELEVPEISYVNLSSNQVKTVANSTLLQSLRADAIYLNPQVKPSHLTYPVPSLVGNRTYTVVHNRKNITGSTKPIELNLGGTVVQLNDASSKTLVKTPSTLAHSNLIFIGGESTVDHIMVLDGDWTNKPIEYFENMKGHDTDAIITIIGDSKIDDVAEQYLW